MKKIFTLLVLCCTIAGNAQTVTDNLFVYRVGDGTSPLTSAATAVFLDEYSQAGVLIRTIALPVGVPSGPAFTASGSATAEGMLNRSTNKQYLIFTGYSAPVGMPAVASSTASTIKRIIGRADESGTFDISTALSSFSQASIRSAISTDGISMWAVGANTGVVYTQHGTSSAETVISTTSTNLRNVNIYDGQLYVSSGAAPVKLGTVGNGALSTQNQTITSLPGLPTTPAVNQFVFLDLNPSIPGNDVLYFADDGAGIQKYSLVNGTWISNGGVTNPGARGIVAVVVGTAVTLYTTTSNIASTTSAIYRTIDLGGYNVSPTSLINIPPIPNVPSAAVLFVSAATNTAFRGIAFAPVAAGSTLPVKFGALTAVQTSGGVAVSWSNLTESDVENYTIERSATGSDFIPLKQLAATKNNGNRADYHFTDVNALNGNISYRVKVIETSGKISYSSIARITIGHLNASFNISPNPVKNSQLGLRVNNLNKGIYSIRILSASGQMVSTQKLYHEGGSISETLPLKNLRPGIYTLEIKGAIKLSKQFIVQ